MTARLLRANRGGVDPVSQNIHRQLTIQYARPYYFEDEQAFAT
jgi:hypothetical protein